jgi:hypothetical protein
LHQALVATQEALAHTGLSTPLTEVPGSYGMSGLPAEPEHGPYLEEDER